MSKDMLGGITLAMVAGLINDLFAKLTGPDGQTWLTAFKRFLRKENPWDVTVPDAEVRLVFESVSPGTLFVKPDNNIHLVVEKENRSLFSKGCDVEQKFISTLSFGDPLYDPALASRLRAFHGLVLNLGTHQDETAPTLRKVLEQ